MIAAIANVIRGDGFASAARRAAERIEEGLQPRGSRAPILNYCATRVASRNGGVAIQLMARLRAERELRPVALRDGPLDVREAMKRAAARAVHLEGTFGAPLAELLEVPLVVGIHDLTLLDQPRELARRVLDHATGVIFPSQFLRDRYRELTGRGEIIEPATPAVPAVERRTRRAIAFAGSVKPHKGGRLLPELAELLAARGLTLHVFGGGDVELLRPLRARRNVIVHGYYRAAALPSLLARHDIGLVLLPSIVPESYSLTLTEAWLAGASVIAFDLGAQADRIRRGGGGWIVPLASGAAGLMNAVHRWLGGEIVPVPAVTASPADAARAHVELYRRWGLL